ncbi:phage tail family protein [Clostridium sp. NSJ-49]|uniref:phage distal tail protein n=1 Tax=Clostridium sp. NSJ-49 TaxID=2763034 RepID=UPI00164BC830|nr:phage tail domain-containing protein [Clostridium sp. NSJ-49]MBC5625011.1 phage tail family protein [Clostridium sp. NSJ-49]
MAFSIIYNNIPLPNFIHVKNVTTQLLPTKNKRINEKIIKVDFFIRKNGLIDKHTEMEFICWLKGSQEEYSKLTLPNNYSSYVLAKVNNIIDIDGTFKKGGGAIEFLCIGNRIEEEINSISLNSNNIIYYSGTAEVKPKVKIKVLSQVNEIKISIQNIKYNNFIKLVGNFNQNDNIEIDMSRNKITKNGIVDLTIMTLDSYFHRLYPGENIYTISENSKCSITLEWQNEFL